MLTKWPWIAGALAFLIFSPFIIWAREEALPEIGRLIEASWGNFTDAYRLAEKAEEYIPNDSKLTELFSKCSLNINIEKEPPGADIYMKAYKAPDSEWNYLGVSPLKNIRLPVGIFRWGVFQA